MCYLFSIIYISLLDFYASIKYMKCSHAPQQAQMSNDFSLAPELDFRHEHDHVIYLKRATRWQQWQQRQLVKALKANALSSSSTATTTATQIYCVCMCLPPFSMMRNCFCWRARTHSHTYIRNILVRRTVIIIRLE